MSTTPSASPAPDLIHVELDGSYVLPPLVSVPDPAPAVYGVLVRDPFTGLVWSASATAWITPAAWPPDPKSLLAWLVPLTAPAVGDMVDAGLHEATFSAPGGPPGDVAIRVYLLPRGPSWSVGISGKTAAGTFTVTGPAGTSSAVPINATQSELQAAFDAAYGSGITTVTIAVGVGPTAGGTLGPGITAAVQAVPPADGLTLAPTPVLDGANVTSGSVQITTASDGIRLQRLPGGSGLAWRSGAAASTDQNPLGQLVVNLVAQRS